MLLYTYSYCYGVAVAPTYVRLVIDGTRIRDSYTSHACWITVTNNCKRFFIVLLPVFTTTFAATTSTIVAVIVGCVFVDDDDDASSFFDVLVCARRLYICLFSTFASKDNTNRREWYWWWRPVQPLPKIPLLPPHAILQDWINSTMTTTTMIKIWRGSNALFLDLFSSRVVAVSVCVCFYAVYLDKLFELDIVNFVVFNDR